MVERSGCGPGVSGFESRPSPQWAAGVTGNTPVLQAGTQGSSPWLVHQSQAHMYQGKAIGSPKPNEVGSIPTASANN